jgi:hypothetical protein
MSSGILRSPLGNVLVVKLWIPVLCVIATVGIFGEDFPSWRFLFALPFIIAALFGGWRIEFLPIQCQPDEEFCYIGNFKLGAAPFGL